MPCVSGQVIHCPHLNSRSVLNEFFENLPATKRNCSFAFQVMFGPFPLGYIPEKILLYLLPLAHGTKSGTILANSSGLFLCPLLPMILFSIFETRPGSWSNIPENLKCFLS